MMKIFVTAALFLNVAQADAGRIVFQKELPRSACVKYGKEWGVARGYTFNQMNPEKIYLYRRAAAEGEYPAAVVSFRPSPGFFTDAGICTILTQ